MAPFPATLSKHRPRIFPLPVAVTRLSLPFALAASQNQKARGIRPTPKNLEYLNLVLYCINLLLLFSKIVVY